MQEFKNILLCFLVLFPLVISAQVTESIEEERSILIIGLGASLEIEESLYGINGRFYYGINKAFCFGPEVSYFPYQSTSHDLEKSIIDLNINAHYILGITDNLGFYPLLGVNYTVDKIRLVDAHEENESETEFGINYGFGAHYNINDYFVFSEYKGVAGQLSAEFVTVGIIYEF